MATLKEIKGQKIQSVDSDPVLNVGSWSAGGNTNKSGQGRGSAGTQTSNLAFGGDSPNNDYVEEYNGTSWTEVADMNTGKTYGFGCGANAEAAMASGGYTNPSGPWFTVTETWNGSSWTEVNDMNTARGDGGMFGVVPGSVAAGGYSGTLNTAVGGGKDHSSVFETCVVVYPPVANASCDVPDGELATPYLAVAKSATSVQLVPSHDSVFPFGKGAPL